MCTVHNYSSSGKVQISGAELLALLRIPILFLYCMHISRNAAAIVSRPVESGTPISTFPSGNR